jgi:hypothetical protein
MKPANSQRKIEEMPRGVLALLSKLRAKGKVTLEELSDRGRLALLEYDARRERGPNGHRKEKLKGK